MSTARTSRSQAIIYVLAILLIPLTVFLGGRLLERLESGRLPRYRTFERQTLGELRQFGSHLRLNLWDKKRGMAISYIYDYLGEEAVENIPCHKYRLEVMAYRRSQPPAPGWEAFHSPAGTRRAVHVFWESHSVGRNKQEDLIAYEGPAATTKSGRVVGPAAENAGGRVLLDFFAPINHGATVITNSRLTPSDPAKVRKAEHAWTKESAELGRKVVLHHYTAAQGTKTGEYTVAAWEKDGVWWAMLVFLAARDNDQEYIRVRIDQLE